MMTSVSALLARSANDALPTLTRGSGPYVYDEAGKKYLDGMAGVAVNVIGHGVPEVLRPIAELENSAFYSYTQAFTNPWQEEFAHRLLATTGRNGSVYFSSGGSETNEVAIKFARQYHAERGDHRRWKIITRGQAYHGNTIGMLSLSGRPSWRSTYDPYLFHSPRVSPLNTYRPGPGLDNKTPEELCEIWVDEFKRLIWHEGPDTIAAFLFEPMSGASIAGSEPPMGYYDAIFDICRSYGILTIADEVFVGYGRTGEVLAEDHFDVGADIVTLAKGLGSGYAALGACLLSERVTETIRGGSGQHTQGYTFSGLPVGCFIGLQVMNYIEDHNIFSQGAQIGRYLQTQMRESLSALPWVGDIRGRGLLVGIELVQDQETKNPFPREKGIAADVARHCREAGLIIFPGAPEVGMHHGGDQIHLTPPFVLSRDDVRFSAETIREAIVRACD